MSNDAGRDSREAVEDFGNHVERSLRSAGDAVNALRGKAPSTPTPPPPDPAGDVNININVNR